MITKRFMLLVFLIILAIQGHASEKEVFLTSAEFYSWARGEMMAKEREQYFNFSDSKRH